MFGEIVQEQSTAHLKPRDLSSKYVQIAGAINSLNSSKQPRPLAAAWPLLTCQTGWGQHPTPGSRHLCLNPRLLLCLAEMTGDQVFTPLIPHFGSHSYTACWSFLNLPLL